MTSPVRLNDSYSSDPYRSLRVNITKEQNSTERQSLEFSRQSGRTISDYSSRPLNLSYDDSASSDYHKLLIRKADDYSQYLIEQNCRTLKEKQGTVNEVSQIVKRGISNLDQIREDEYKGLGRKIADHNNDFGKKIKELEKNVIKQVEKLKLELMENIRKEETESERRIGQRSKKLVDEAIPTNVKDSSKPRAYSSSPSPTKTMINSPEKKMQNNLAMRRLEESREKIRELQAQYFQSTPGKEVSNVRRFASGGGFYDSKISEQDFDQSWD